MKIRKAIALVLHASDIEDIDERMMVSDMGGGGLMTIVLTKALQKGVGEALGVKVPPA